MIIENISVDRQAKLFMALERNLSSLKRRNITYVITTYSDLIATVTLQVNGRKGMVTKIVAVNYDGLLLSWIVYIGNKKYILNTLSELATICKSMIAKISATVTKI